MSNIILENGFTYDGVAWSELLDATVIDSIDQTDLMPSYKEYKGLLNYVKQPIISKDQKYSARYANGWLSKKEERGNKAERWMNFWPKKWIYQQTFSEKFSITEELTEWMKNSNTIKGAPESVQAEFLKISDQIKDLTEGYDITWADLLVRVYAKWFSITSAEWPWSATAKGKALFASDHSVMNWDGTSTTYSNLYTPTIDYDNATESVAIKSWVDALQSMLNTLKTSTLDNGRKIKQAWWKWYDLYCSRLRETFWLKVLNDWSNTAALWNNEWIQNQFRFKNNIVNLKVIDTLWDYDSVEGENIGNENMVFVANPVYIKSEKCFKCYELYAPKVKTWMNDDTDEIFTSLKCSIWADHYYAEYGIVWNDWT